MPPSKPIRAIDLFCGVGGSSWGAQAAGVKVVAAFDLWELAGKNFSANFPRAHFYPGRLEDLNCRRLVLEVGRIDLILASPECRNHSPARGNKPDCDISKNTAFQVVRIARALLPRWIIIENVVSMRRWSRYKEFKGALENLGYRIREQVLNATDFGVPQKRRRLFILCDREEVPRRTPSLADRGSAASSFICMNGSFRWSPLRTKRRAKATLERANRAIKALGRSKPFLLVYYGSDKAGGWQQLSTPLRTITTLDRFAVVKPSAKGYIMRMLQVPELQAAMGMDRMRLPHGTRREKIKMIGNAVCPPVMREVVSHLTKADRRK